ncbi:MAG TPA: diguanylate cyclase [Candidatus Limnocylindrales bacterium]|nr:diguanylate cyclase [Candidatus Limnocylindrales bacterium]
MTDAARPERALRAGPGVTRPLGGTFPRMAAWARDRSLLESAALLLPILVVGVTHTSGPGLWLLAAAYLAASVAVGSGRRAATTDATKSAWISARILVSVAMVAGGQLLTGSTGLLSSVYLPIIALSAFAGPRMVALAVATAVGAHWTVETIDRGVPLEAVQRALGFAAAALLVAFGTRREVARIQRARVRLRQAMVGDRRRARQIAGVEAIGRILATHGPTRDALDEVVGRVERQFGYRYVSLYLGDDRRVDLGAQRGYSELVEAFDGKRGIVGRVMRSHRPAFVPDVGSDPDYWGLNPGVRSEICVPLMSDDDFLGFVNVESVTEPLDTTDLQVMVAIADRLAAALIIGRDRQRLEDRANLFRHLHEFSEAVNGTLQPDELYHAIVRSVSKVVAADVAALHVLDRESGRYLLAAAEGSSLLTPGAEARSGDGMAGRAIRDRTMIVDDAAPRPPGLRTVAAGFLAEEPPSPMLAAAVPLIRDRAVLGALTLMRFDRSASFSDVERDALAMLGEQASLAVTNVFLHAEVAELALRDPLTGLFNRRYLDPALDQLFARRARLPIEERVPLAAIMFDLDHFSELNNRHGHQVGDEVLRAFGSVLRKRMRTTDLVARFGGEEFAAILYRATLDDAVRIANEIREQLAATPVLGASGEELSATVSAGCAAIGPEVESPDHLLRAADVALYMAKRAGRDRVCAA